MASSSSSSSSSSTSSSSTYSSLISTRSLLILLSLFALSHSASAGPAWWTEHPVAKAVTGNWTGMRLTMALNNQLVRHTHPSQIVIGVYKDQFTFRAINPLSGRFTVYTYEYYSPTCLLFHEEGHKVMFCQKQENNFIYDGPCEAGSYKTSNTIVEENGEKALLWSGVHYDFDGLLWEINSGYYTLSPIIG